MLNKEKSGRILFVDDEECIRELASEIISKADYNVVLATNGVDATGKALGFGI